MKYLLVILFQLITLIPGFAQIKQGFVHINDGKLFYQKKGIGPPLVFLHGLCLDHRMWEQQVAVFSKSFTCISIDLRGFGKSSLPDTTPYSFHADINTVLDSLQIREPVVLIALSMGGKAAVNFALAYPDRTLGLVLVDAMIDGYKTKEFKLDYIYETAKQKGIDNANHLFLDHPIYSVAKTNPVVYRRLKEMVLSYSGWQWVHKNPIQGLTPPAIEQLEKIKMPVLIITGEKDNPDFQEVAEILHKNIMHSIKKQIPGAGHMTNMEKPDEFNGLLAEFLNSNK